MKYMSIGMVVLLAGGCPDDGPIEPRPDPVPLHIAGVVSAQSERPLAGASVHVIVKDGGAFVAETKWNGEYSLREDVDRDACIGGVLHADVEVVAETYVARAFSRHFDCDGPWPLRIDLELAPACLAGSPERILIDASHSGGAWWFPQTGPVFFPDQPHQGQALAAYLRSRGYTVDELGRGTVLTAALLAGYPYVVRYGEFGTYAESELLAYERFLECDVTLALLSGHRTNDPRDELAEHLGVTFSGSLGGSVNRFALHDLTQGVGSIPWVGGTAVSKYDPDEVEILGWVGGTIPVMGIIESPTAEIFFMGDTYAVQFVEQPLIDNIIAWGF